MITVSAESRDGALVLQVSDDGPGFGAELPGKATGGVGIANTRARLNQLFGEDGSLSLENRVPSGAAATISLPMHTHPISNGKGSR